MPCVRSGWFRIFSGDSKKEHYRIAKENIDIINRKCHDLKHQIAALRDMCTKEEREKYIEEIQDSIQIYEAMVKTGNDVLDTILTEKSLACKENDIVVSCVADGKRSGVFCILSICIRSLEMQWIMPSSV